MTATKRWRDALESWAIPDEILAAAPASPFGFPVEVFEARAERASETDTPSRRRALEALPDEGSVLDVGCGAGAAALALVPPAGRIVGVDESAVMLEVFARLADARGIGHTAVEGRWPEVAGATPSADVVVCHHVFYNVADLANFARELTTHARRRVVVELTRDHPMAWTNPFWLDLHGVERPDRPVADDAVEVLEELGLEVGRHDWDGPFTLADHEEHMLGFLRTRLCLTPDRDREIRTALQRHPPPASRPTVTLWWDI